MGTAQRLLKRKGATVITIEPAASVLDAARLMNKHHIGSLLVCDNGRMVGIFTERDVMRRVVSEQRDPSSTPVSDVMTTAVACAAPHTTLDEIRNVMHEKRIRHIPVIDDTNSLLGMISIGDVNRATEDEQILTIRYLEQYMTCL